MPDSVVTSITRRTVSADQARAATDAAVTRAVELGAKVTVTVLDASGTAKATLRMDGAPLISIIAAYRKAYTVIGAVGVSGAHDTIDAQIAQTAARAATR